MLVSFDSPLCNNRDKDQEDSNLLTVIIRFSKPHEVE